MDFKIGDVVQIGTSGHKGKIVNIIQPTGTYSMYTIRDVVWKIYLRGKKSRRHI
jgi:hypothetical protein